MTVGYGDIPLERQVTRLVAVLHITATVTWLASFIEHVGELAQLRGVQLKQLSLLTRPLSMEKINSFDADGNGVDKCEFVVGMLLSLGVEFQGRDLDWDDVEEFTNRFRVIDFNNDGSLTADDIVRVWEHNKGELMKTLSSSSHVSSAARSCPNLSGSTAKPSKEVAEVGRTQLTTSTHSAPSGLDYHRDETRVYADAVTAFADPTDAMISDVFDDTSTVDDEQIRRIRSQQ
jgi:hypothetical protein